MTMNTHRLLSLGMSMGRATLVPETVPAWHATRRTLSSLYAISSHVESKKILVREKQSIVTTKGRWDR